VDGAGPAIAFRLLRRADFDLLSGWLEEPVVARWWNHDTGRDDLERDFGAAIDGDEPTEVFIASLAGIPFGLIQRYRIDAYPDYLEELRPVVDVPPAAVSVDYLIGVPSYRGRGLGAAMITALVEAGWSDIPWADAVVVPVATANTASWRALERAGFRRVAEGELEPDNPIDDRAHVVYRIDRPSG
jgi:aminoglycoside 6'-N-acetyltransferase